MDLSRLSDGDIQKAIQKMQKGIEIKPGSEEAIELQTSIDRALEELQRRAQKKSVSGEAPKESSRQEFFKKQAQEYRESGLDHLADKVAQEVQSMHLAQIESAKAFESNSIERVLVATVEPAQVVKVPVVQITLRKEKVIEHEGKRVKQTFEVKEQMTQSEILTMLKTYFKTLVNSENWKAGRYTEGKSGNMGFNVFELFKGWNAIHNITNEGEPYPPVNEVYPGYRHTSQDQRVGAELLLRWAKNENQAQ